ncbi:hypothetical protein HQ531_10065 [bacterium]|nr:hypothetical protein [bacterium]
MNLKVLLSEKYRFLPFFRFRQIFFYKRNRSSVKSIFLALSQLFIFVIFPQAYASDIIPLNDTEKQIVDRGQLVVRELDQSLESGNTFEVIGLMHAPRKDIVEVLIDYKAYSEFMPHVSKVETVENRGNQSVLNFILELPLNYEKKYRISISLSEPDMHTSRIEWHSIDWPGLTPVETIKETTGYWLVYEKTADTSLVLHHVYTDPGPIPFGLGWIIEILTKTSVPKALSQTRTRVEKAESLKTP